RQVAYYRRTVARTGQYIFAVTAYGDGGHAEAMHLKRAYQLTTGGIPEHCEVILRPGEQVPAVRGKCYCQNHPAMAFERPNLVAGCRLPEDGSAIAGTGHEKKPIGVERHGSDACGVANLQDRLKVLCQSGARRRRPQ